MKIVEGKNTGHQLKKKKLEQINNKLNDSSNASLGTQTYGVELGLVNSLSDNVTGCGIMSNVWGMILSEAALQK